MQTDPPKTASVNDAKKDANNYRELAVENDNLRTNLVQNLDALCCLMHELDRKNKILSLALKNKEEAIQSRAGQIVCEAFKKWHAPFTLPFRLAKLWYDEIRTWAPRSLGGKTYAKIISCWENGGFDSVEALLASDRSSPFAKANGYTALARYLETKGLKKEIVYAARRACEIDPREFRQKWLALKLNELGDFSHAHLILETIKDKIPFSNTETKTGFDINLKALLNGEQEWRARLLKLFNLPCWLEEDQENAILCKQLGEEFVTEKLINKYKTQPQFLAMRLLACSRHMEKDMPAQAFQLAKSALEWSPTRENIKTFFLLAQKTGNLLEACEAIRMYAAKIDEETGEMPAYILDCMYNSQIWQLDQQLELLRQARKKTSTPEERHGLCYVLHNSLPYSSGGYATRSQGMAKGLTVYGHDLTVVTRPGYPLDLTGFSGKYSEDGQENVEDVPYQRIYEPRRNTLSFQGYAKYAADALEKKFIQLKPALVMAASNHTTALPALIAASRLKMPFIYEVRGLWEITHLSREKEYGETTDFIINKILEVEVCKNASHVFTLTNGLKEELIKRGVAADKITIIPNACDPLKFQPAGRDESLAADFDIPSTVPVIGYVGTFVIYEGLEDLARACGLLRKKNLGFRLLLVGNENASGHGKGPISAAIEEIARENDFESWLIMPGRVPHEEVKRYYSLIDIAPFPRKPWPVCELVSPMKPLEAMAMEKAVLVSSTQALGEMVKNGETGLVFEKGNVQDLANKLEQLLLDADLRHHLGGNARIYVEKERNWSKICGIAGKVIDKYMDNDLKQ